jgi:hypothetical protein
MRIALFTPYSPEIGGGSVQLRSHIQQMKGLDVRWNYLAKAPVAGPGQRWLGKPLTPLQFGSDILTRTGLPGSSARVKELVKELDAELYWHRARWM